MEILIRYIHFLSLILLCGSLLVENVLIRKSLTRRELVALAKVDALFGLSAVSVLIAGLLLWFVYGKRFAFYAKNPVFQAKVALFAIVGLLSIKPTIFFLKQRKGPSHESVPIPNAITRMVRIEMALVLVIPLLAVVMAKGIGLH